MQTQTCSEDASGSLKSYELVPKVVLDCHRPTTARCGLRGEDGAPTQKSGEAQSTPSLCGRLPGSRGDSCDGAAPKDRVLQASGPAEFQSRGGRGAFAGGGADRAPRPRTAHLFELACGCQISIRGDLRRSPAQISFGLLFLMVNCSTMCCLVKSRGRSRLCIFLCALHWSEQQGSPWNLWNLLNTLQKTSNSSEFHDAQYFLSDVVKSCKPQPCLRCADLLSISLHTCMQLLHA